MFNPKSFIGQQKIIKELNYLLPEIKKGLKTNILLSAPSRYGKTTLAYHIMEYIGMEKCHAPKVFSIRKNKLVQFLDEIHTMKVPENIYPYMDSQKWVFILATNELGNLKEPLVNRCTYTFIFTSYTEEELVRIADLYFEKGGIKLPNEFLVYLAGISKGAPGILVNFVKRLTILLKHYKINDVEELKTLMKDIMDIDEEGLNAQERVYIEFLKAYGPCSLSLISGATGLDKQTITRFIEPRLVKEGEIRISSRGREYAGQA